MGEKSSTYRICYYVQFQAHWWSWNISLMDKWGLLYNTINCLFFSFPISNLLNYLMREAEF